MNEPAPVDAHAQVSVESDGKILTGQGEPSDALTAHIDRRESDEPPASGAVTDSQPTAAPGPVAAPAEPQTRGQKRFSELTKERDAATAREKAAVEKATAIEREVTELRAKVQQASTPQQAAQAQQQLTQAENKQQAQPVNGQRFSFPAYEAAIEQYPDLTYDQWQDAKLEAFGQWKDAQFDARIQARFDSERTSRTIVETAQATHAKGRAVYKDFDTMLAQGPGSQVPLGRDYQEAMDRAQMILRHPRTEHLQYAILKDGDLARKLQQASPMEFGMLVAEIAAPAPAAAPAHPAPPAPFQPVGSGSSTTATPSSELAKRGFDFDSSGYREKRAAERGLRRAR